MSGVLEAHAVECREGRGTGGQGVTSDGVREDGEAPEEALRPVKLGEAADYPPVQVFPPLMPPMLMEVGLNSH